MAGGEEQFQQMKESGSIDRATQRIDAAVERLNMTPASIVQLFIDLWNGFTLNDLAHPIDAFQRIIDTFGEPIGRLIAFVVEIVKIVVVVILEIMNFPFDLINNIISRTLAAFENIKKDPIGFLKNLLRAIKQGFVQFFGNIATHLINGVVGWLMSELRDAGIPELTDFSLQGVIGWVLEVLGISMEKIWEKLAAHPRIGPERVARIRGMIDTLEGIWTFIKDVQERGIVAIWEKIQEQLTNLWDTVIDAVKNWVMEKIITQITTKLLSMLDPTGIMAVINSCIAIYSAIQSFIKYLREMLEVINSFVNGVADIAEGKIETAANYLENTMGRAMPIVIGFLANQVGLGGIGRRVGEMIESVRGMVDQALTWLVNKAVDTGMNLLDRAMAAGRSAASTVLGWLGFRERFRTPNGIEHTIYTRQDGDTASLIIESTPMDILSFFNQKQAELAVDSTINVSEKSTKLGRITHGKNLLQGLQALMNNDETKDNPRIPQMITEVIAVVQEIESGAAGVAPPVSAVFQPGFSNGVKATSFNARFMHKGGSVRDRNGNNVTVDKNHPDGSEPGSGTLSDAFQILTDMRLNNRWVRFHIVNAYFGGAGMDSNLIPTPNYINNPEYLHQFENPLKNHYDNSLPIWIQANITYRPQLNGLFPLQYQAEGGAMKFDNNQWVADTAKQVSFNKSIDMPDTQTFNINYLIANPSELTLLVNLSTVTTAMFNIIRTGQPSGGYTYLRQMERVIANNILGPDSISLDEEVINRSGATDSNKRKARDYKTRLGSTNWTF
jgi:phage-related protein